MPEEDRIANIIGEWLERRESGEDVPPEDVIREHPEIASELREHFDALGLMALHMGRESLPAAGEPRQLGDYRILREIGRGGMGVVYEADQVTMGRRVALKVLSPAVTSGEQAVRRFQREARAAGQLHHTSVVPIYGMGEDRGLHYYAMELVEGETVAEVVAGMCRRRDSGSEDRNGLGLSSVDGSGFTTLAVAAAGVAEALEAAHQEGIVHRDVKPTNLLLSRDRTLKLVDFGLARLVDKGASMTMTGQVIGTPHYMSPEQAQGRQARVDHRTDIYSLGVTLYEILTLRTPFQGESFQELCSQIIAKDPVSIRKANPRVPRDLETIVAKAMEKDRERRYASAGEMAGDLRRFAEGMPIRARRIGSFARALRQVKRRKVRTALTLAVVVLLAVGGILALLAAREGRRRAELEYASLCSAAGDALARSHGSADTMHPDETASALFRKAIDLLPMRPEAYLGRALAEGRTLEQRLADLDAARAHGLSEGTWRLGRAHYQQGSGMARDAASEAPLVSNEPASALDAYFRARLAEDADDTGVALVLLNRAEAEAEGAAVRYLLLRARAGLKSRTGDDAGALRDLHAVLELGDGGPSVRISLAHVLRRSGQPDEAAAEFELALAGVRRAGDALTWMWFCLACREEMAWHERVSKEACEAHGDSADLLHQRIVALRRTNRPRQALVAAEGLIADHPRDHRGYEEKARALQNLGQGKEALPVIEQALDLEPRCAACLATCGSLHLWRGESGEAVRMYERAIDVRPGSALLHANLGDALVTNRTYVKGLRACRRAVELAPDSAGAHASLAQALFSMGHHNQALDSAEKAVALDLESWSAHLALSLAHAGLRRPREALLAANRAIELVPEWAAAPVHHARSWILSLLYQDQEALEASEKAVELNRNDTGIELGYAGALCRMGQNGKAREVVRRVLERNSRDARAIIVLSWALLNEGELVQAVSEARKAVRYDSESAKTHLVLGVSLVRVGKHQEALEVLEQAITLDPDEALAHAYRGSALTHLGRDDESLDSIGRALRLDPRLGKGHPVFIKIRGSLHNRRRQYEKALSDLDWYIDRRPEDAAAYLYRASVHYNRKDPGKAREDLRLLVEIDPARQLNPPYWGLLTRVLADLRNGPEALPAAKKWIEFDATSSEAHYHHGVALSLLCRFEEALEAYVEAIRLDPRNMLARLNRGGILCDRLGKYDEAIGAFRELLELDPGNDQARISLGVALAKHGEYEDALKALEGIEASCTAYLKVLTLRGMLRQTLHRYDGALEAFGNALEIQPGNLEVLYRRGNLLHHLGRNQRALEDLDAFLKHASRRLVPPDLHCTRATVLVGLGRYEAALAAAARSVVADPTHVCSARGYALLGQKKYDEALEVAGLLGGFSGVNLRISVLRDRGDVDEARRLARDSVRSIPEGQKGVHLAWLAALAGETELARAFLYDIPAPRTPPEMYYQACVSALLGDVPDALLWLERAVDGGFRRSSRTPPDPDFESLCENSHYRKLSSRMLLEEEKR